MKSSTVKPARPSSPPWSSRAAVEETSLSVCTGANGPAPTKSGGISQSGGVKELNAIRLETALTQSRAKKRTFENREMAVVLLFDRRRRVRTGH